MFAVAAGAILVAIGLALIHAFRGPTLYDRILAVNMVGTNIYDAGFAAIRAHLGLEARHAER